MDFGARPKILPGVVSNDDDDVVQVRAQLAVVLEGIRSFLTSTTSKKSLFSFMSNSITLIFQNLEKTKMANILFFIIGAHLKDKSRGITAMGRMGADLLRRSHNKSPCTA